MSIVGIVATLQVKNGKAAEFEKIFNGLSAKVKANEKGCLLYDLFKSKEDPQTYVIMEQYASQADLDAHMQTEYFQAAFPELSAVLAAPPGLAFVDKA